MRSSSSVVHTGARHANACAPRRLAPLQRRGCRQCTATVRAQQSVSQLPTSLQKIVGAFQMVPDPMARYKQLLFYAAKLPPMASEDHVPGNKVEGCVSQVWVKPELRADGLLYWSADSDSQLTKGLAALLVLGLSGCTPQEILGVEPTFIELLGLKQSLTPSRNNGFLNMFLKMQRLTLAAVAASDYGASGSGGNGSSDGSACSGGSGGSASSGSGAGSEAIAGAREALQ